MDVSVIVVNYNTLKLTKDCIDSIYEKTKNIKFEVILVDNASTDGSKEFFENDVRIKYIYNNINLGFGKANNLGYKYAEGKYIFLLNSDTLLVNNAIYELANFMNKHLEVAICGGLLLDSDMKKNNSYGLLLPSVKQELDRLFRNYFSKTIRNKVNSDISSRGFAFVSYITGADIMLRRERIEELGMFDEDFFMYFEETEMTYRYSVKGYKSAFYPKAMIQHFEGKSFSFKEVRERMYLTSRKLYFAKTGHNLIYYYICNAIYIIYLITSIIKNLIINNKETSYYSMQIIKLMFNMK